MTSIHMDINDPASMTDEKIVAALKEFGDGATLRAMRGLSDEEMEAIYAMGVNFYKAGNYEDAEKVFKLLALRPPQLALLDGPRLAPAGAAPVRRRHRGVPLRELPRP